MDRITAPELKQFIVSGKPEERQRKEGDFVFSVEWIGTRATVESHAQHYNYYVIYAWK